MNVRQKGYWGLRQVLAWICFRDRELVEREDYELFDKLHPEPEGVFGAPILAHAIGDFDTIAKAEVSLFGALSAGELRGTARKGNRKQFEEILPVEWDQLEFSYSSTREVSAIHTREYCRRSNDQAWARSYELTDLQFPVATVTTLWPDPAASGSELDGIFVPYRTGAPGRPSSKNLVEHELEERAHTGTMEPTLRREAEALSQWLKDVHPKAAGMTSGTIENAIRDRFRKLRKQT